MRIRLLGPTRRLSPLGTLAFLFLILAPVLSAGDEATLTRRLNKAKDLEKIQGDTEGALEIYATLARRKDLSGTAKGDILAGAARCHEVARRFDAAAKYWSRIVADPTLSNGLRTWARRRLDEKAKREETTAGDGDGARRRHDEEIRAEERRAAQKHVAQAREALRTRRFQNAAHLCLLALKFDPKNEAAQTLLDEIEAQRPDLGDVLGRLIQFVQTKEMEEFEWLRGEVANIRRAARLAFDHEDWREADRLYRRAIGLIDDSGFLTLGATMNTGSLGEVRARLLHFLRATLDEGKKAGLSFEPEPELPDVKAAKGSGARALFGTLADMFTPREAGAESLHFFEFAPDPAVGTGKPLVTSRFVPGLKVEHAQGSLTRARWTERWIRRNIGAHWMSAGELAKRRVGDGSHRRRRLLIRVGDLICAQCGEQEQGRIEALQRAFGTTPTPLRLDVRLYATSSVGSVVAAQALRTQAGPRDTGLDHVVAGRLLGACVHLLDGLKGVTPLGRAQVNLDQATSLLLEVTRFTAEHPAYLHVKAPALTIEDADKRYGLWLDLYAEDMPSHRRPGNDRSALSVRARVTQPDPLYASHIVPRPSRADPLWTRRPILLERVIEADREVQHYGTFVLQGIPNPFPESNQEFGELLVLIGTTRQDTPTPDPPRATTEPAVVPADLVSRDYRLGPLSTEVEDQGVSKGWPALHAVAEGLSPSDRQRLRDGNLANILLRLAGIDAEGPGAAHAIVVQDHLVHGTLSHKDQIRLQRAVQRLRSHENDLYEVSVQTADVPAVLWKQWTELEGMERNARGHMRVRDAARAAFEKELDAAAKGAGLFNTKRSQPARATQQITHMQIRSRTITKDLRRRVLEGGRERFTAVPGVAEEGIIVEVRPHVEIEGNAGGLRMVHMRAQVARLDRIEKRLFPKTKVATALYDVPLWHAGTEGTHSETVDAEILDDETLLVMALVEPGAPERRVIIALGVRKAE